MRTGALYHDIGKMKHPEFFTENQMGGKNPLMDMDYEENIVAEGTEEKVKEVEDAIIDGSLHVFDTSTFTVDGKEVTTYEKDGTEYVSDGYFHESEFGSAPAFDLAIDGITSIVE